MPVKISRITSSFWREKQSKNFIINKIDKSTNLCRFLEIS